MATLKKVVRSAPLSAFSRVTPEGDAAMWDAIAGVFDDVYKRLEPAAAQEMADKGTAAGREAAGGMPQMETRPSNDPSRVADDTMSELGLDGGDYGGFNASLARTESGGNYNVVNSEGYGGKYQFGQGRLDDFNRANGTSYKVSDLVAGTPEAEQLTERVQAWHLGDIDQYVKDKGLDSYLGQSVGGVTITQDGMRAMAHLGGKGGMEKFLRTGGQYNPSDSNGTHLSDYARTHAGASGGRTVMAAQNRPQPVSLTKADGTVDLQLYSPLSGPILQAHNAAARAAYGAEVLDRGASDLLQISQQYLLDPEGFEQAAQGYIDTIVASAPSNMRGGLRADLSKAAQRRVLGIAAERQADTRKRAANSNLALVERYTDEYAEMKAAGDEEGAADALSRLQTQLGVRERLPGLAWTREQSGNRIIEANKAAERATERKLKEQSAEIKGDLNLIIKAAKEGLHADNEGLLNDPNAIALQPELAREARAFVTLRDTTPGLHSMPPDMLDQVVADTESGEITEDWEVDVVKAVRTIAKESRKAWESDPIAQANRVMENKPPAIPEYVPGEEEAFVEALTARRNYGLMLQEGGYTETPTFFSKEEADKLSMVLGKESPAELRAAVSGALVAGFGNEAIDVFDKLDIAGSTKMAGKMFAAGSEAAAVEAMHGQALLDEGVVSPPTKAVERSAFTPDMQQALDGIPGMTDKLDEVMSYATAIYAASAAGVDPGSDQDKKLFAASVQKALGQSVDAKGRTTGGIQDVLGQKTLLPLGMSGEDANGALRSSLGLMPHGGGFFGGLANLGAALSGEKLEPAIEAWQAATPHIEGGSLPMFNGQPIPQSYFQDGGVRIVSAGRNQYRMEIVGSGASLPVEDKNGNVLFFDLEALVGAMP